MRRPDRGTALALVGVGLLVATLGGGALLAPTIDSPAGDARTLVSLQGGGPAWQQYGAVFLRDGNDTAWREGSAESYFDVERTDDGTVLAAFADGGYEDCGPYESPCARTGYQVIDPRGGATVVDEYSFPVRSSRSSEVHAVEPLPSGEVVVADMDRERVFTVRDGEITWQWNASRFYDAPPDPTRTDWLHVNDVDVLGPDRYLVSVRNANQLLVIERDEGVVEVINADRNDEDDGRCRPDGQLEDTDGDGDIRCGDPTVLDHQHNPQWLGDGAVLVADSHNDRIVELQRNADGEWRPVWVREGAGGVDFDWPRDADRLPDGRTVVTDTLNRRILVLDGAGGVEWSVETDLVPYEADRLPHGEPVGAPTMVAGEESVGPPSGDVPLLSTVLLALKAVYPGVPYWFDELELGATLLGLALVLVGGAVRYYDKSQR